MCGVSMVFAETDFSGGSRISQTGLGTQFERRPKFPENCMKMKKIGPRGGVQNFTMLIRHWNYTIIPGLMLCEASNKKSERTLVSQLFVPLCRWRPLHVSEPFALIAETINIDVHTKFHIKTRIQGRMQDFSKEGRQQACVKNSVYRGGVYPSMHWADGGCLPQCMLGYTPPPP